MTIRIGTRGSPLALAQAEETRNRLVMFAHVDPTTIEIVKVVTTGDRVRDRPLAEIGGKGLFTKEIEEALHAGAIDIAVHSMKDIPAIVDDEFTFAAVLPREDARDAMISTNGTGFFDLPQGAVLGSSSVRRTAQAMRHRPDLQSIPFRGNVDTRLRKLTEGLADATFLACAGLNRLGLKDKITEIMPEDVMLPAVAQGAIGIEVLKSNDRVIALLQSINHTPSATAVACERAFLKVLEGSCRNPLAGHAKIEGGEIDFRCEALTLDGRNIFAATRRGSLADAARLGADAGNEVKARGGSLLVLA